MVIAVLRWAERRYLDVAYVDDETATAPLASGELHTPREHPGVSLSVA